MAVVLVGKRRVPVRIDAEDAIRIAEFSWHLAPANRTHRTEYVRARTVPGPEILMHRLLLGPLRKGVEVDHINGDGLDNRKANLRVCTRAENAMNRRCHAGRRSKGVYIAPARGARPWRARIQVGGRKVHLGWFQTERQAVSAYDVAAPKYHGEFAKRNVAVA